MGRKQIRAYVDGDTWANFKQQPDEGDTETLARVVRDYDKLLAILCTIDDDPLVAIGQMKQVYEQVKGAAQPQPPPPAPAPVVPVQSPPPAAPPPEPQAQKTTGLIINMPVDDEFEDDAENF